MKLNKISNALRKQGKGALYTSAMLSMLAAPAYAQAAEEAQAAVAADDVEVIEVRGMRGTMTRSLNEKKNTAAIVDAIAAADFGDLPGLSLSDVIENVSGAAGHRLKGSQNEISIRGLGSYWGYATFNGRTITNAGPGRAVNFKKFPSDLVDKVVIYKTQQADLVEGGTSGTIEVGSVRAVDYGKSRSSLEVTGIYNDYYNEGDNQSEWGNKITFSTVQSWETDSIGAIGFSFGYVKSDSANPEENYGTSSTLGACSFKAADGTPLSASGSNRCSDYEKGIDEDGNITSQPTMVSPGRADKGITTDGGKGWGGHVASFDQDSIFYIPDDSYWRTGHDDDQRSNIVATVQWVPNDAWDINFDLASSRLDYTEKRMELAQERAKYMKAESMIIDDDGTVLYEEGEGKTTLQGEKRTQADDYDGYGLAVDFQATENLELTLDASYSESYRYRLRQRAKFRHESYVAYSLDSRSEVPKLYFGDDENIEDANFYLKNVDGELVENHAYKGPAFDVNDMNSFVGSDGGAYMEHTRNNDERNDDIWAIDFNGTYTLEDNEYIASIKAGMRWSREHLTDYSEVNTALNVDTGDYRFEDNWNTDDHVNRNENGSGGNDFDATSPVEHANMTSRALNCGNDHSFDGFLDDADGAGQASQFATFESTCIIGAILDSTGYNQDGYEQTSGYYDIGENPNKESGKNMDIREDILAAYVMANVDTEVLGYPVTGNIGMRAVRTETKSKSYGETAVIAAVTDEDGLPVLDADGNQTYDVGTVTQVLNLDDDYTEYLPSMNLTVSLTDEWLVKIAAYRAMSRFAMNAMSAGVTVNECEDSEENPCSSYDAQIDSTTAKGNMMDPYTSSNYDLSLEWYPSQDMAITLGGYWKNFTGGTEQTTTPTDTAVINVDVDGNVSPGVYPDVAHTANQVSGDESTIKGFELTWQKHFAELPGVLSGLGIKGAWNHAISDFDSPEPASPGLNPDANLFGFSEDTASASVYWEGDSLSMRLMYKYRSRYFQPNNLPFPYKVNRWVEDSEYLDAAVKYKFNKNFEVSLKALNLLEEPQVYTRGGSTVSDYSYSGTKYFLSAKAKF